MNYGISFFLSGFWRTHLALGPYIRAGKTRSNLQHGTKNEVSKKYIKEVLIRKTDPFFAKVCLPNLDSKEGLQQVFRDPGLGLFKGRDPRILSQK